MWPLLLLQSGLRRPSSRRSSGHGWRRIAARRWRGSSKSNSSSSLTKQLVDLLLPTWLAHQMPEMRALVSFPRNHPHPIIHTIHMLGSSGTIIWIGRIQNIEGLYIYFQSYFVLLRSCFISYAIGHVNQRNNSSLSTGIAREGNRQRPAILFDSPSRLPPLVSISPISSADCIG